MPLAVADRIPGVLVRDVEPRAEERPRLDVAGFVGLAERGPVDTPVRIDDLPYFETMFGRIDVELTSGDEWFRPALGRAVRSFFENGGRRCWVVRVSGAAAKRAEWILPPIIRLDGRDTVIRASSPGAWANPFQLALRLRSAGMSINGPEWVAPAGTVPGHFAVKAPDEWEQGDVLRIVSESIVPDNPGDERLFHVARVAADPARRGWWRAEGKFVAGLPSASFNGSIRVLERLRFDIEVIGPKRDGGGVREHEMLSDLAFGPGNSRYWMDVLRNASIYLAPPQPEIEEVFAGAGAPVTFPRLLEPDTPLENAAEYLMPPSLTPAYIASTGTGTDDFAGFTRELIVPNELRTLGAQQLQDLAAEVQEQIYRGRQGGYVSDPIRLPGLLALLPIDEIGLLAVPDAMQLKGRQAPPDDLSVEPLKPAAAPPTRPDFECCTPGGNAAPLGDLSACAAKPAPPAPTPTPQPEPPLQSKPRRIVYGFDAADAVEIQQGMVRFCSLRGDVVAVLATPRRARDPFAADDIDEIDWRRRIESAEYDFSYAALYAPWTLVAAPADADPHALAAIPPDGAACGTIAKREIARGVWVAPANEPLRGIIGLDQRIDEPRWADLIDAGVNLVRPMPGDFRIMSARTLALEPAWSQLNVRRLMIYLRKLLLWWGRDYVFENNRPQLRAALQRRIERELYRLYRRGAFAGATEAESYQVEVAHPVNTPQSVDLGHMIALVKVAPSWPMEWLEVRLVRTGEGPLQVQEA